jgi:hypothetical protein
MWTIEKQVINLPGNRTYIPKTDDLTVELIAAAKAAGLEAFNVKINGHYFEPSELPTNSIKAIIQKISVEAVEVSARDTAG